MVRTSVRRRFFSYAAPVLAATVTVIVSGAQDKPKPDPQKTAAAAPEFKDLDSFMKSLPAATVKPLDPQSAMLFTALPLACLDDLQPRPTARPYFWQPTYRTVENHDKVRAFYGCNDWSTAVNATWTIVTLVKKYPDLPVEGLIREKLTDHLGRQNLEGELAYFRMAGNFQRPYGHAWLLRLFAELSTWRDADGARYSDNVAPLARFLAESLLTYLIDLDRPVRMAGQTNSAFALGLLLDYSDITRDTTISRAVGETAKRLFAADTDCATDTEAASPEMVSPCLAEAALMSRVLDQGAFVAWFDKFMPPAHSNKFKPLRTVSLDAVGTGRRGGGRGQRGAGTTNEDPAQAAQRRQSPRRRQHSPRRNRRRSRVPRRRRPLRQLLRVLQAASVVHRQTRRLPIRNLVPAVGVVDAAVRPPAHAQRGPASRSRAPTLTHASRRHYPRMIPECRCTSASPRSTARSASEVSVILRHSTRRGSASFAVSYLTTTGAQPGTGARSER